MRRMELFTHPTLDQLHQLGLAGMARAFAELEANPTSAALSHAEWLGLLLDREITERYERRLRARLRFARLRHQAAVDDVDYRAARGLDRALFQALIAGRWINEAQNLIIEGPSDPASCCPSRYHTIKPRYFVADRQTADVAGDARRRLA